MNSLSIAFNRHLKLADDGKLVPVDEQIEVLQKDFQKVAAKYIGGSKKVQNIKKFFSRYFMTVAEYFIHKEFDLELIDSNTYKEALSTLDQSDLSEEMYQREKLVKKNSVEAFEKKLQKQSQRLLRKKKS